jgi:GxxExxY protein
LISALWRSIGQVDEVNHTRNHTNMNTNLHENLLHKVSYQIQGAAIEVRKNFGSGLKESIYQKAFAEELRARNMRFETEKSIQIFSPKTGKLIGSYRPDFIVEEKVVIEIKAVEKIPKLFLDQIYSYLKNSKYELGYFINFASPKLYIKRTIFTNDRKPFLQNTRKGTNIKRMSAKLSCLLVFLFVLFSVFAPLARAAEVNVVPLNWEVGVDQNLEFNVSLSAPEESINAIRGEVGFPTEILELKEIKDSNSIISLWLEKPHREGDKVVFAGIIPGGFNGINGQLFSLLFRTKKEGSGVIELRNMESFLNDGRGTPAPLTLFQLAFTVKKGGMVIPILSKEDTEPPESFTPEVAREETLFDGKWFLVFATQDKASGVDHYEVLETRNRGQGTRIGQRIGKWLGWWKKAESPYVLRDQGLRSFIFVKAVDKAGNERIVKINPQNPLPWYENYENWLIIVLLAALIFYVVRKILRRKYLY